MVEKSIELSKDPVNDQNLLAKINHSWIEYRFNFCLYILSNFDKILYLKGVIYLRNRGDILLIKLLNGPKFLILNACGSGWIFSFIIFRTLFILSSKLLNFIN